MINRFYYNPDSGILYWKDGPRRNKEAGTPRKDYYKVVRFDGKLYLVHRIIWFLQTGLWPDEVDHDDRDPSNNKWANLKESSRVKNNHNVFAKGYTLTSDGYYVRLFREGKVVFSKFCKTESEASITYWEARREWDRIR